MSPCRLSRCSPDIATRPPDKAASRDPLDIPGLLLVTSGLFCLVYGFSHAETTAWSNPFTIGFLVAGVTS